MKDDAVTAFPWNLVPAEPESCEWIRNYSSQNAKNAVQTELNTEGVKTLNLLTNTRHGKVSLLRMLHSAVSVIRAQTCVKMGTYLAAYWRATC